jgi:hypothetical protein
MFQGFSTYTGGLCETLLCNVSDPDVCTSYASICSLDTSGLIKTYCKLLFFFFKIIFVEINAFLNLKFLNFFLWYLCAIKGPHTCGLCPLNCQNYGLYDNSSRSCQCNLDALTEHRIVSPYSTGLEDFTFNLFKAFKDILVLFAKI